MSTHHLDSIDWARMIIRQLVAFSEERRSARSIRVAGAAQKTYIDTIDTIEPVWNGQWNVLRYL